MNTPAAGPPARPSLQILRFDADGPDRELALDEVDCDALGENELLWIDVTGAEVEPVREACERLQVDASLVTRLMDASARPALEAGGAAFTVQCVAVEHRGDLEFAGVLLNMLVGRNFLLTVHSDPIAYLDELRSRQALENELGALSAEAFAAAVLDWQLSTYFDAVSDFEIAIERLEVGILGGGHHRLDELRALRRAASRLRRMLAPHRRVFAGLARPDFQPRQTSAGNAHFQNLDTHYERAMDAVENARDLVVGSFELFTSQTAWRTNRTMQALTFYTVLLGVMAVVVGAFGMNFDARVFRSGNAGFWLTIAGMLAFAAGAAALARRRRWL